MTTANRYRFLTVIAAFIFFLVLLFLSHVSFAGDTARKKPRKHKTFWYWREVNKRGIERYQYNRPGWPYESGCSVYYTNQPIKSSTLRMLHWARRVRG